MIEKIAILGAGESGVGAAILAKTKGFDVFVSDYGTIKKKYKAQLIKNEIPFEEGTHTTIKILASKEVIKSPGIPDKAPIIQELKKKGIPVINEIEFAVRYTNAKIIGITGSNGKTTTTLLTYQLLKKAGMSVGLAGNVGYSFAEQVATKDYAYYVLELSSFQLDDIQKFQPNIAVLLNITADHLDRYEYKVENYIASKFRILMNQSKNDLFIYNAEDNNMLNFLGKKQLIPQGIPVKTGNFNGKFLHIGESQFDTQNFCLKGEHNMFNTTCAIQVAKKVGVSDEIIQQGMDSFTNVPHRLEVVAHISGIEYINDSKATNVDAAYFALKAMTKPIVWIAGGTDKGNDYEQIMPLVRNKVKALICLGKDNTKLVETFSSSVKILEETNTATEAIQRANIYAETGDVVLLSPACASFDLFDNYEQRGDLFREAVLNIRH
ncbi:MAG: UDP-N-acetylmuramoylalanine--D-glutamate ligase [Maribacter sp.]